MVTSVGTSNDIRDLVTNFIQLEHDAISAYKACIDRLESPARKETVSSFLSDHERHLRELQEIAREVGADVPQDAGSKSYLTTGKVKMADMVGGDGAVLKAMSTNETDTVTAYDRGKTHAELTSAQRAVFERAHSDEEAHKQWMEQEARAA